MGQKDSIEGSKLSLQLLYASSSSSVFVFLYKKKFQFEYNHLCIVRGPEKETGYNKLVKSSKLFRVCQYLVNVVVCVFLIHLFSNKLLCL